jgi:hypothetical protein
MCWVLLPQPISIEITHQALLPLERKILKRSHPILHVHLKALGRRHHQL